MANKKPDSKATVRYEKEKARQGKEANKKAKKERPSDVPVQSGHSTRPTIY